MRYFEHRFPLDPATYPSVFDPGRDALPAGSGAERVAAIELESILRALQALPPHRSTGRGGAPGAARRDRRGEEAARGARGALAAPWPSTCAAASPRSTACPASAASFERLHELLERQAYRLAYWRVAADEINYRRFFDINDLAALRMENPDGVRGDAPQAARAGRPRAGSTAAHRPSRRPLRPARLPRVASARAWPEIGATRALHRRREDPRHVTSTCRAAGPSKARPATTSLNVVNGLFVVGAAERDFDRVYRAFTGEREPFESMLYECKQQILAFHLSSELTLLAHLLYRLAESRLETRDFTLNELRSACCSSSSPRFPSTAPT